MHPDMSWRVRGRVETLRDEGLAFVDEYQSYAIRTFAESYTPAASYTVWWMAGFER